MEILWLVLAIEVWTDEEWMSFWYWILNKLPYSYDKISRQQIWNHLGIIGWEIFLENILTSCLAKIKTWLNRSYPTINGQNPITNTQVFINIICIGGKETEYRLGCTRRSFAQICKMVQNQDINIRSLVIFLNSLFWSIYGFHVWRQTRSEISKGEIVIIFFYSKIKDKGKSLSLKHTKYEKKLSAIYQTC